MRALTRTWAAGLPPGFRIPRTTTTSPMPMRSFSSLRPLTLNNLIITHNNHHPNPASSSKRPTLLAQHHQPTKPRHHLPLQRRSFSLLPLLESTLTTAQTLLTTLHTAAGTPWYLTIPLFALVLNLATRLPATLYSRRVAVRRQRLEPLARAAAARVQAEVRALHQHQQREQPEQREQQQQQQKLLDEYVRRSARETTLRERRAGVQRWKHWLPSLAAFPVWIAGIEALRRMCGGPRGLLGSLIFGAKAVEQGAERGGSGLEGGGPGLEGGVQATSMPGAEEVGVVPEALAGGDISMATGGCLWFPDLMVADPYHILPVALSAILVLNMLPRSQAGLRLLLGGEDTQPAKAVGVKWRMRLQRALLMVAVFVGPATMDLPAALHLYWIASATVTWAQTAIIWRLMPLPKTVAPAKKSELNFVMPRREEPKRPPMEG